MYIYTHIFCIVLVSCTVLEIYMARAFFIMGEFLSIQLHIQVEI